jgi:hypothetical protein
MRTNRTRTGALVAGALFAAFVVVMAVRALLSGYALGGAGGALAVAGLIGGGTALLVLVGILVASRLGASSRGLVEECRRAFPEAQVFRIYGEADFVIALRLLSGRARERFPHFGVLVIREGRIEIYAGSATESIVQIPGQYVERATADSALTSDGVPRPTVTLVVAGPAGGRVVVPFVVMRETRGSVLPAGIEQARAVVASVDAISAHR